MDGDNGDTLHPPAKRAAVDPQALPAIDVAVCERREQRIT